MAVTRHQIGTEVCRHRSTSRPVLQKSLCLRDDGSINPRRRRAIQCVGEPERIAQAEEVEPRLEECLPDGPAAQQARQHSLGQRVGELYGHWALGPYNGTGSPAEEEVDEALYQDRR